MGGKGKGKCAGSSGGTPKPSASGIGAFGVKIDPKADPMQLTKINDFMREVFDESVEHKEPTHIFCDRIIVDSNNRGGQDPDVHYLHFDLVPSFIKDGYDDLRPRPGIVRRLDNQDLLSRQVNHNLKLMEGTTGIYPPLHKQNVDMSSLGGSHTALGFRGMSCGMRSSLTGEVWGPPDKESKLGKAIAIGHKFFVVKSTTSDDHCKLISEWHNKDQDQNAGTSPGTRIRVILNIIQEKFQKVDRVPTSVVIAAYAKRTLMQVDANVIGAYTRYIIDQGHAEYVEEFLTWLSKNVNSSALVCPPSWMEDVCKTIPLKHVLTKLITTLLQLSGEGRIINQRPAPDTARFISVAEMNAVAKDVAICETFERFCQWNRLNIEVEMRKTVGSVRARDLMLLLELNLGRLLFSKTLLKEYVSKAQGRITADKMSVMRTCWCDHVATIEPGLRDLAMRCGIAAPAPADGSDAIGGGGGDVLLVAANFKDHAMVNASNFKDSSLVATPTSAMAKAGMHVGAVVSLIKKVSTHVGPENHYCDINAEATGRIRGECGGAPIVQFTKVLDKTEYEVDVKVKFDNIKLAAEGTVGGLIGTSGSACGSASGGAFSGLPDPSAVVDKQNAKPALKAALKKYPWLHAEGTDKLEVVKDWTKLVATVSDEQKLKLLHSMVGYSMQHVLFHMPSVDASGLLVVIRDHEPEIWTLKDFGPGKISFAAEANEWKDRNWSQDNAALVQFDTSLHPKKLNLVICGRLRKTPSEMRPFSLFFAVTRVSETASANLKVGYAKVEAATTVRLPMDGKVHESVAPALPQIPVMWNERKIVANTKLTCTYDADLKKLTQAIAKKRAADLTADQRAQAKKKTKTEDESTDKAIK